jgi:hypothetical protein
VAVLAGAALVLGVPATPLEAGPRFGVAVQGGVVGLDEDLDHYAWDVGPRPALGLVARVASGPWGAGLRLREWTTEQSTGSGADSDVRVQGIAVEATGRFQATAVAGARILASGGAGRLFVGYEPDHITLNLAPGAAPVTVAFAPIETWLFSLGVGVERPLGDHIVLGAELERDFFSLDTAHRSGSVIVNERESFGATNLRLTLAWEWGG